MAEVIALHEIPPAAAEPVATRHDRPTLAAFVADGATEKVLRDGLAEALPAGSTFHHGGIDAAIDALRKMPTPITLIVDLSGATYPLTLLSRLSDVVEPNVRVLVVGDIDDVDFYRAVTHSLGALEYLPKPLTRDTVRRHLLPFFAEAPPVAEDIGTARIISVTGSRGGVGTTTIAANLAWHFGFTACRHTALLDPDLYMGSAAMLLDSSTGPGLRIAVESPDRVDALFVERAAQPASERLHVLGGEVKLSDQVAYAPNCALSLMTAMCSRYAMIVVDAPFRPQTLYRDLLDLAHQRVLIAVPTVVSVRDTLRLLALPPGPGQTGRGLVVLNRAGLRGGLTLKQVEAALGVKVDVVIPDQPRQVELAASMGQALAAGRNSFARGIVELAQQSAFVRLLESSEATARSQAARPWWRRFL
nr:hypothetical protein [uncultured Rhodopila sp.]